MPGLFVRACHEMSVSLQESEDEDFLIENAPTVADAQVFVVQHSIIDTLPSVLSMSWKKAKSLKMIYQVYPGYFDCIS